MNSSWAGHESQYCKVTLQENTRNLSRYLTETTNENLMVMLYQNSEASKSLGFIHSKNWNVSNTAAQRSWVWGGLLLMHTGACCLWSMLAKMSHVAKFLFYKKLSREADVELWWEPGLQTQSITGIKVLWMRSGFSGFSSHKCHHVSQKKAKGRPHTQEPCPCWNLLGTDKQWFSFSLSPFDFLVKWRSPVNVLMKYFSPKWRETSREKGSEDWEDDLICFTIHPFSVSWG